MTRNMPGIVGDFTPDGMAKAMKLPPAPIEAISFQVKELGGDEVELVFEGERSRVYWTRWREMAPGEWKIIDVEERDP